MIKIFLTSSNTHVKNKGGPIVHKVGSYDMTVQSGISNKFKKKNSMHSHTFKLIRYPGSETRNRALVFRAVNAFLNHRARQTKAMKYPM